MQENQIQKLLSHLISFKTSCVRKNQKTTKLWSATSFCYCHAYHQIQLWEPIFLSLPALPFTSVLLPTSSDLCCPQHPVLAWLGQSEVLSTWNCSHRPDTATSKELLNDIFPCMQKPYKHRWLASHFTSCPIQGGSGLGAGALQCSHRAVTFMGQQHGHNTQEWKWPCPEEQRSCTRDFCQREEQEGQADY